MSKNKKKKRKHSNTSNSDTSDANLSVCNTPKPVEPPDSVSESINAANSVLFTDVSGDPLASAAIPEVTVEENVVISTDSSSSTPKKTYHTDVIAYLQRIEKRLSNVDSKLEKLDSQEGKMTKFESDLSKLRGLVYENNKTNDDKLNKMAEKLESLEFSLGLAKDEITQLRAENVKLDGTLTYMQSQSMRNNLVFTNISEVENERNEDTERILRQFVVEKMKVAQNLVDEIRFERVHRVGEKQPGIIQRNIVAKFTLFKDREMIRRSRRELKGTRYYVNEQFPKAVADRRKALRVELRKALDSGKRAWISYDTLYVNGVPQRNATSN